jgi:hypothetical protein
MVKRKKIGESRSSQPFIPNILATVSSSHFTAETVPFHSFDGACSNIETTFMIGAAIMLRKRAIVRISRRACSTVPLTPFLLIMSPSNFRSNIFKQEISDIFER